MTRPIVGFLAEFTAVPRPADVLAQAADSAAEAAAAEAEALRALVEAARAEGHAAGCAATEAAMADRFRALADAHAAMLDAARVGGAAAEGLRLAEGLRAGLAALEALLADSLVEVVTPFIAPAIRRRTALELRQALADLIAGHNGALIEIRGPADILDTLRVAAEGHAAVVLTASEDIEVLIEGGDATIRSQLQAWSERFEKTMAASA